jgi:hypothetical protein
MTNERVSPSPLAGEGAERKKREAGEGPRSLTKYRSIGNGTWRYPSPDVSLTLDVTLSRKGRGEERGRTMRQQRTSPSPAGEEGKKRDASREGRKGEIAP